MSWGPGFESRAGCWVEVFIPSRSISHVLQFRQFPSMKQFNIQLYLPLNICGFHFHRYLKFHKEREWSRSVFKGGSKYAWKYNICRGGLLIHPMNVKGQLYISLTPCSQVFPSSQRNYITCKTQIPHATNSHTHLHT